MKLALALLFAAQLSCAKYPALTVGIAGGAVGLASCEIQGGEQKVCGIVTGAVAIGLGGLAWLVTHFADTSAHELPPDDETLPDGTVRVHSHTALPPVPLDAGGAAPSIDAGVPVPSAAPVDAGVIDAP